jgi:hypothetical protein
MKALRDYLRTGVLAPFPPGMTADNAAQFGLMALFSNANLYSEALSTVVTAGTNSTLTPAQLLSGVVNLTSGASGGFTITLPSTTSIISAMGSTVPTNGTFAMPVSFMNNGTAQTGTVTIGDASTTLTGTATVATNTRRTFLLTVNTASTITLQNLGSIAL